MSLYLVVDPLYADTYWCNQYMKGIHYEALQGNRAIHELQDKDFDSLKLDSNISNFAMLLSNSLSWIPQTTERLINKGMQVVLISPFMDITWINTSYVCADLRAMVWSLCTYVKYHRKQRVALFGCLPDSSNDALKRKTFNEFFAGCEGCKVFINNGNLEDACSCFYAEHDRYDAVLCCNDIAAIKLTQYLTQRGVRIPDQLWLCSIGDARISRLLKPNITTVMLDCISIGRQAVKLCMMLSKTPLITTLHAMTKGWIDVRESTGFAVLPPRQEHVVNTNQIESMSKFYSDETVNEIFDLESLISHSSSIDIQILKGIRDGSSYMDIANELFLSESTIKYRLRRMSSLCKRDSREDIVALVESYFDLDRLIADIKDGC